MTNSKKYKFITLKKSTNTIKSAGELAFHCNQFSATRVLGHEVSGSLAEHLKPLWLAKNLPLTAPVDAVGQGYGVGEPEEARRFFAVVKSGPVSAFELIDAVVMPTHNHITLEGNYLVSDIFGADDEELNKFMNRYGKYFGYNKETYQFEFEIQDKRWSHYFSEPDNFKDEKFTPIHLSNHISDWVFAHWHATGLYKLYYLDFILSTFPNPLLIFSYQPKVWQVEMLSYYFPTLTCRIGIVSRPTRFKKLVVLSSRNSALFDGKFLAQLYKIGNSNLQSIEPRKLFVSRGDNTWRKIINYSEINGILLRSGYQIVRLTDYSYRDQVQLIKSADSLIFVSGSDFMATLHTRSNCNIGVISYSGTRDTSANFCSNFGHHSVNTFHAQIYGSETGEFDLYVDPDRFINFIKSNDL